MGDCKSCEHYNGGSGNFLCLSCRDIEGRVSKGLHEVKEFQTLGSMIMTARESKPLCTLVGCLKKIDTRDALIFLQYKLNGDNINTIAAYHEVSRVTVWRAIKKVKTEICSFSGVSTSTSL